MLGSASVADVKRSENKLYNIMNDETIMKCNHNLLHEQNWLITRPDHKFRKFLLPVDFPKRNGICYLLTHYCLCHVCQHTNGTASYIKTNNTRLRNICTVLQYDPTAFRNGRMIMTSQALRVWYMYDRLMKDY